MRVHASEPASPSQSRSELYLKVVLARPSLGEELSPDCVSCVGRFECFAIALTSAHAVGASSALSTLRSNLAPLLAAVSAALRAPSQRLHVLAGIVGTCLLSADAECLAACTLGLSESTSLPHSLYAALFAAHPSDGEHSRMGAVAGVVALALERYTSRALSILLGCESAGAGRDGLVPRAPEALAFLHRIAVFSSPSIDTTSAYVRVEPAALKALAIVLLQLRSGGVEHGQYVDMALDVAESMISGVSRDYAQRSLLSGAILDNQSNQSMGMREERSMQFTATGELQSILMRDVLPQLLWSCTSSNEAAAGRAIQMLRRALDEARGGEEMDASSHTARREFVLHRLLPCMQSVIVRAESGGEALTAAALELVASSSRVVGASAQFASLRLGQLLLRPLLRITRKGIGADSSFRSTAVQLLRLMAEHPREV
ncbi:MAG: hypothetical protein SGPRY_006907, partial [Prymnesium sp.]